MPEPWQGTCGGEAATEADLDGVARELLAGAGLLKVWLFYGEMGSGKTTLIKAIGRQLGVKEGMGSPTFSIVNEYIGNAGTAIFHFDCYRLKHEHEAFDLGMEEYLDSGSYCFVEWPEKVRGLYPPHHLAIRLTTNSPTTRKIEYRKL